MCIKKSITILILFFANSFIAQADYNYTISSEILTGTCDITLSTNFLSLDESEKDLLEQGYITNWKKITYSLSKCGIGPVNTKPTVFITGSNLGSSIPSVGRYLFTNNPNNDTTYTKGFGIILSSSPIPNWDVKYLIGENDAIDTQNGNSLYLATSCGNTTSCNNSASHQVGRLTAALTFNFEYR
ncbi:hypothetical protein [Providencia sneebia]|uniref:Uncharacterized protein n=1 Tax=Providencia sneebia DSM 19967 TaxID=1141660 RepID=K8WXN8_9GAMM|nr:hypothetical protein [Providencia sneebia]EKT60970.1 hypothetical protein OO7_02746 [Providencia sneebia DSM 19967]